MLSRTYLSLPKTGSTLVKYQLLLRPLMPCFYCQADLLLGIRLGNELGIMDYLDYDKMLGSELGIIDDPELNYMTEIT